ncbi:hypothetical protein L9F63_007814, partial [Diploptera punctata]
YVSYKIIYLCIVFFPTFDLSYLSGSCNYPRRNTPFHSSFGGCKAVSRSSTVGQPPPLLGDTYIHWSALRLLSRAPKHNAEGQRLTDFWGWFTPILHYWDVRIFHIFFLHVTCHVNILLCEMSPVSLGICVEFDRPNITPAQNNKTTSYNNATASSSTRFDIHRF